MEKIFTSLKSCLFICTILIATNTRGQDYYGNNLDSEIYVASQAVGNPTAQPPDIASFQKVNFVPVSNYTGRANITIPIYEISAGEMTVPISLSYNTSGVKVADMASSVGLGWNLNATGVLSRMVRGMDDFHRPHKANSPSPFMTPSGWLGYTNATFTMHTLNRYNDAQPDLFVANAPGLLTKYIHKKQYKTNTNGTVSLISTNLPDVLTLSQDGSIINETKTGESTWGFDNVEIINISGIVYNFSSKIISYQKSALSGGGSRYKFESHMLDSMYDPSSNQTITFEYEEYTVDFYDLMPPGITKYGTGNSINISGDGSSYTKYHINQRLKKIIFDKGSVEFIYGLNRLDNPDEKALTEIKVVDHNNNLIKHYKLSYTYFQTPIHSGTPQSKRLRLDRVYEVDSALNELPGYTFAYNTSIIMPPRDSYAHDFLGYNNGSYNAGLSNPTPQFYFKDNYISPFNNSGSIQLTGNFSLEANANYAQAYSLTRITYPTNGYSAYEYELNEYSDSGNTRKGGGIRIKSQKIVDEYNNEQILDYSYGPGYIAKMPVYSIIKGAPANGTETTLSQLTGKMTIHTFLTPQSQVEFTQGAFVGYYNVTVKNHIDNGKVTYYYSTPSSDPNLYPNITYDTHNLDTRDWVTLSQRSLWVDMDFLRGKPVAEFTYDKNNVLKLSKNYYYTTKEFSSFELRFLNRAPDQDNCYYDDGTYSEANPDCDSYWEDISIPIARDLLTTVETIDYQPEYPPGTQYPEDMVEHIYKIISTTKYDKQYPLVVYESKSTQVCQEKYQGGQSCADIYDEYGNFGMSKQYKYPLEGGNTLQENSVSSMPYASQLIALNKINTPLDINYGGVPLHDEKHYYNDFNGKILLEKIEFTDLNGAISESEIITKRDSKGRVLEYKTRSGDFVTRLYGYDDHYLVAEIVNSTWNEVQATLPTLNTPYNQTTMETSSSIRSLMYELREALPHTRITSYTYKPLAGITSTTDAKGYTTYYEYDSFNRLEFVKDADGNLISENQYHYKNQQN